MANPSQQASATVPELPEMALAIAEHDWSATLLGPKAAWPQSLKTAIDMMLGSGHGMCIAWGPERTFLYNDAYIPMLGERNPGALGQTFAQVWPDVWADVEDLVDRTFAGETCTFKDLPLIMTRKGNAEDTWWSFSYSPIHDEADKVTGLLNVTLETTARVEAERERDIAAARLRASEDRLRALVNASSDGVYTMNSDWTEMRPLDDRGITADAEMPTVRWIDQYLFPKDVAAIQDVIDKAIAAKSKFEMEHRVRRTDGSEGWTSSRAVPVLAEDGSIAEWFGMSGDVTLRHQAEDALRDSEAFMASVLSASTDCIKVLDLDGRLTFMSEGGQQVMEVSDFNAISGCPWPDFWTGAGNAEAVASLRLRDGARRATSLGKPRRWPAPGNGGMSRSAPSLAPMASQSASSQCRATSRPCARARRSATASSD